LEAKADADSKGTHHDGELCELESEYRERQ
jgi:hypothetical protein